MTKKTKEAFTWIVSILRKHKVPFQITGGFAARIYGSNHPINDIDIEIPEEKFDVILKDVQKYIIYGPKRDKDKVFDLELMTLKYKGQEIDIAGSQTQKLFDKKKKKWISMKVNYNDSVRKKIYDLIVPVETKENIVCYKRLVGIGRDVDIEDVNALSK